MVVLCGSTQPEIDLARETSCRSSPSRVQHISIPLALPFAARDDVPFDHMVYGAEEARRAARLIAEAGASDRASLLRVLRTAGPFDEHGDPVDPPVWLWRADSSWVLRADRPL